MLPDLKVVSQSGNKFVLYLFKVFEFNLMGVPDVKGDAFGIWGISFIGMIVLFCPAA